MLDEVQWECYSESQWCWLCSSRLGSSSGIQGDVILSKNRRDLCLEGSRPADNWIQGKEEVGILTCRLLVASWMGTAATEQLFFTQVLKIKCPRFLLPCNMVGLPKVCDCSLGFFCTTKLISSFSPWHQPSVSPVLPLLGSSFLLLPKYPTSYPCLSGSLWWPQLSYF